MSSPISEAQLLANRANALLSTGPRTAAGKAISSMNGLKVLPGERHHLPIDMVPKLRKLKASMIESLHPANDLEQLLINQVLQAKYNLIKLRAAERAYYHLWAGKAAAEIQNHHRKAMGIEQERYYEPKPWDMKVYKPRLPKGVVLAWMLNDEKCPLHRLQLLQGRYESSLHRGLRQLRQVQQHRERTADEKKSPTEPIFPADELETGLADNTEPNWNERS